MKKFTIKGVLDGIRGSVSQQPKTEVDYVEETLRPEHFQVMKTVRHGFPYQPTAMAFDPVQRILAIGTKSGSLRILGQPGVDCHVTHEVDQPVIQILFLVNEGALVSVCANDSLHLWNLRQKLPDIVHSLKFQKERITYCHLPFQSKWLYIGTERGNVHVVNIESFLLSGYVINWNKAIELSRKTHPGAVTHLSDNPVDSNKLLIGFESGSIVFWDLKMKTADIRFQHTECLHSVAWHHEGKQFMCSHSDGSLTTWNVKTPGKPVSILFPHAKTNKDGKLESCKPITKLEWKSQRGGEMFIVFCGGLPHDRAGRTPSITVIHGKTTTVLEMEHTVIDFITLCESPWQSADFQEPYAIVVLLHNDLVVVDLSTPGYLCFENPYPMDLHESPVTCCLYLANCPADLVPAFYSVGSRAHKRSGYSEKAWPISGGAWGTNTCSYADIIITGHADGSMKFWDASHVLLEILYKLKTAKIFEKPKAKSLEGPDADDPFAIQQISLCPESRLLAVANASSHVVLFHFSKSDTVSEVPVLEIPIIYEVDDLVEYSPDYEYPPRPTIGGASHHGSYASSSEESKKPSLDTFVPLQVRSGPQKRAPGFQPLVVCQTPWVEGEPPGPITSLSINSSYGLMAYGNESGLVIVDIFQKTCLLNIGSPDLYGSSDPYQRIPRSPKKNQCDNTSGDSVIDRCRSPTSDQLLNVAPPDDSNKAALHPTDDRSPSPPSPSLCTNRSLSSATNRTAAVSMETLAIQQHRPPSPSTTPKPPCKPQRRHKIHKSISMDTDCLQQQQPVIAINGSGSAACPRPNSLFLKCTTAATRSQLSDGQLQGLAAAGGATSPAVVIGPVEAPTPDADVGGANISAAPPLPTASVLEAEEAREEKAGDEEEVTPPSHVPPRPTERRRSVACGAVDSATLGVRYKRNRSYSWKGFALRKKSDVKVRSTTTTVAPLPFSRVISSEDAGGAPWMATVAPPSTSVGGGPVGVEVASSQEVRPQQTAAPPQRGSLGSVPGLVAAAAVETRRERSAARWRGAKFAVMDLRNECEETGAGQLSPVATVIRRLHIMPKEKIDNSFSRSRSSSMSSLENITSEAIQCLTFIDSYNRKGDSATYPNLWVGTSLGSVLVIILNLPPTGGELRQTQPVIVSPSGTIFRLKGSILAISFLDCNGALIHYQYESWKDINRLDVKEKERPKTPLRSPHNPNSRVSPTTSSEMTDRQFAILASEKQACVIALPSQTCAFKTQVTDTSFVVKADVISIRDSVCLACYIANGHLATFSLPSLRPLMDVEFLPLIDLRIARTFCFSNFGNGMYLCSPCEIQKFTISGGFCDNLNEMLGDLFLPCDTPEAPKEGFFKNLFGGGPRPIDREELFGEASGKPSRSVAKHIPGNLNAEHLNAKVSVVGGEVARAHKALTERGENLGRLEDRSVRMMSEAENFSHSAHQLMMKQKDKKWYQF